MCAESIDVGLAGHEGDVAQGLAEPVGAVFLQLLTVVEPSDEEQVGDLLDDLERVADAPRPEGIPDAVDLALELSGDHPSQSSQGCSVRAGPARLAAGAPCPAEECASSLRQG